MSEHVEVLESEGTSFSFDVRKVNLEDSERLLTGGAFLFATSEEPSAAINSPRVLILLAPQMAVHAISYLIFTTSR